MTKDSYSKQVELAVTRASSALVGVPLATLLGTVALLATGAAPAAANECPNEVRRQEQGAAALGLPECRAYEMVTPPSKGSGEPLPIDLAEARKENDVTPLHASRLLPAHGARAAVEGNRMAWVSEPLPGARAPGISYLSTRSAEGWASEDLVPPMSPFNDLVCPQLLGVSGWSPDLTRSILDLPAGAPRGFFSEFECGHDEPRLVPGEPEHFRNLFVHDNVGGSNRLVNVTPSGVVWPEPEEDLQQYWPASFLAASDDLSHVVFEEELALTPDAPVGYRGGNELYEWANGGVQLVTILPGGTPVHGSLAGATRNYFPVSRFTEEGLSNIAQFRHAVSTDGSRIFFEATGGLYLHEGDTQTVQVDESQGSGPGGGGRFMVASADGSRAFFTDDSRLTGDSTASSGEPDLYEYNVGSGELKDLTIGSGEQADVLGVSGASEDGSYLYFVAQGVLSEEPNSDGDTATVGQPNLYLFHDGATTFIATLDRANDECDWTWNANCSGVSGGESEAGLTSRVSTTGEFLAFNSVRSLTGYDNADANTGEPDIEIFLYDAAADRLSCASCSPDGVQPTAGAALHWPARPSKNGAWHNAYPQRNVSDPGQVFFETAEALLPRDGNGRRDVYEYVGGQLHLLSTGTDEVSSHFLDATPDGNNIFFSTAQRLLPRDTDEVYDYYDARVVGGFAEPSSPVVACEGEACRDSAATAPASASPGSAAFEGPGNPSAARCRKSLVRRHGRCVKRAHRHRKHRRGLPAHHRATRHNRRAAK